MSCQHCPTQDKRFQIILSDHSFELRKLTEDKAQEKALFELALQKELRKWQEKYHKEKLDHDENSRKWLNKIDATTAACQLSIADLRTHADNTILELTTSTKAKADQQISCLLRGHEQELRQLRLTHGEQKNVIDSSYRGQLEQLERKYLNEIARLKKESKEREDTTVKEYQSTVFGLKIEKSAEEKENARLQEEHKKQRSKYLSEIYDHRSLIRDLQANVKQLKLNLSEKERELEQKKDDMVEMCKQHLMEQEEAEKVKETLKKQWQECLEDQIQAFCEKELRITRQYEQSVKSIEERREFEKDLYRNNIGQISACMENRPSRVEDIEEILNLREKLGKKQRQYDLLEKQVKLIRLELDNKEDTYNRIFIPSVNSAHLNENTVLKRKELKPKLKRVGKSVSTVRDILNAVNANYNNLPSLTNVEKKYLPPNLNKIL